MIISKIFNLKKLIIFLNKEVLNMKRTLVLVNEEFNGYFPERDENFYISTIYNNQNLWHRIFRKIVLKVNFNLGEKYLFKNWIKLLDKVDTIILFDTGNAVEILSFLQKIFNKRIILWYWNPVAWTKFSLNKIDRNRIEIWSYNKGDCVKYHFKYNVQFYLDKNKPKNTEFDYHYDVFFIGTDKNRNQYLNKLENIFKAQGISSLFYLVKSTGEKDKNDSKKIKYQKPVSYKELIYMLSKSKAIIDLVPEGQNGLTLRPLEALYYKKKLITNMKQIKEYDLYNPKNVFILGEDDISKMSSFIDQPYDSSLQSQLSEEYSEKQWLLNFYK